MHHILQIRSLPRAVAIVSTCYRHLIGAAHSAAHVQGRVQHSDFAGTSACTQMITPTARIFKLATAFARRLTIRRQSIRRPPFCDADVPQHVIAEARYSTACLSRWLISCVQRAGECPYDCLTLVSSWLTVPLCTHTSVG